MAGAGSHTPPQTSSTEIMIEAVRLYRSGNKKAALDTCRHLLSSTPNHAEAAHLAGILEGEAGHLSEAVRLLRHATALAPNNPSSHAALAASLSTSGQPIEAVDSYRYALVLKPDLTAARIRLGDLLADLGRRGEAIDCYEQASKERLLHPMQMSNLGSLYAEEGAWDRAIEWFREALARDPRLARTHSNLGNALKEQGRLDEAIVSFHAALAISPADPTALTGLGAAHLKQDNPVEAVDILEAAVAASALPTRALCYLALALAAVGRHDQARHIADPERHVTIATLPRPDGFDTLESFNMALVGAVTEHPTLAWEPAGKTTRGGAQTGDLLQQGSPTIHAFETALRQAIDGFLQALEPAPGHPHFCHIPAEYELNIWGTVLRESGRQQSHIHASAWMSGVYYAELPHSIGENDNAGWIEFGQPGYGLPEPADVATRMVEPKIGRLVLFPSYLFHRTVPFAGADQRVSVAFDLLPLRFR